MEGRTLPENGLYPWPQPPLHSPLSPSNRLRDILAKKERECQSLMQRALQQMDEASTRMLTSEPPGERCLAGAAGGGCSLMGGSPR